MSALDVMALACLPIFLTAMLRPAWIPQAFFAVFVGLVMAAFLHSMGWLS